MSQAACRTIHFTSALSVGGLVRLSSGGLGPPDETASLSVPLCTQQSISCGAALAGRLDPLAFSGDKWERGKAPFLRCAQRNIHYCAVSLLCDPMTTCSRIL